MPVHVAIVLGLVIAGLQPAGGEGSQAPTSVERGEPAAGEAPARPAMPPSQRLGLRAALVRSRLPVNPVVVLVPDERSYAAAVGQWRYEPGLRYPVLIDDGSWAARQAIARFVRAFKPTSVVRWSAPEDAPWPGGPAERQKLLERLAAEPWGVSGDKPLDEALRERWEGLQFVPPGVVAASVEDPAWPAALALAAGRGQPLVWVSAPGNPSNWMTPENAAALERAIEEGAERTGRAWAGLGDDLDAVTICLNCSTKVFLGENDQRAMLSLTDWVGRRGGEGGPEHGRWAWAGQVIGNTWQSAYSAMCSLFLTTESAWLFDGYESSAPWNQFDMTQAATVLEQAGISTIVDDEAGRSLTAWRKRAGVVGKDGGGVDAGLVLVNSSGNPDFFDLKPGQGRPGDVPLLPKPAIVHFVHSWSAAEPGNVETVAGRWLERGAYVYVGSVHEPYLQAFVPSPKLAQRLAAGLPIAAAARLDDAPVWKVSILGDPLTTLGKTGPVVNQPLPLAGSVTLEQERIEALKAGDFEKAITALVLSGRDKDAADLAKAVLRERADELTPEAALAAAPSAFFGGDVEGVVALYRVAQPLVSGEQAVRAGRLWNAQDLLWHALWPTLGTLRREEAQLLSLNLRGQTLVRDAGEAYSAVSAAIHKDAAREVLTRAARQARTDGERRQIEQIGR